MAQGIPDDVASQLAEVTAQVAPLMGVELMGPSEVTALRAMGVELIGPTACDEQAGTGGSNACS